MVTQRAGVRETACVFKHHRTWLVVCSRNCFEHPRKAPLNNTMSSLRHLRRPQQAASLKRPLSSLVSNGRVRKRVVPLKIFASAPQYCALAPSVLYIGFMFLLTVVEVVGGSPPPSPATICLHRRRSLPPLSRPDCAPSRVQEMCWGWRGAG